MKEILIKRKNLNIQALFKLNNNRPQLKRNNLYPEPYHINLNRFKY